MLKDQFLEAGLDADEALALAKAISKGGLAESLWTSICESFLGVPLL